MKNKFLKALVCVSLCLITLFGLVGCDFGKTKQTFDLQENGIYYAVISEAQNPYMGMYVSTNGDIYATQTTSLEELCSKLFNHTDPNLICFQHSDFVKSNQNGCYQYLYVYPNNPGNSFTITIKSATTFEYHSNLGETTTFTLYSPAE